jgi:hypothetical protein
LAKILFIRSMRAMSADDFRHERIELSHQCASRLIVMLERSMNKRTCVSIIHVIESASTPVAMTATGAPWLQFWVKKRLCQALVIEKRRRNEATQEKL